MLWNANNTFGFHRVEWGPLNTAASITTVSRYMKFRMWEHGQNPMVVHNGIPREAIVDPDPQQDADVRHASASEHLWFKIGRFDPDKRWLMAVSAAGELKRRGRSVTLLLRGGREPHAIEVMNHAHYQGLVVKHSPAPADVAGLAALLQESNGADVINLTSFVSEAVLPVIYSASDAVLANSGHEPFGLVGLEVMAAGGLAVTGSTGEDYAEGYRNALVMETDDPREIVSELTLLKERPRLAAQIRKRGRTTAKEYVWEKIIDQLAMKISLAAEQQGVLRSLS
jgi:glycosyltransferase involved in cell wall biosynthesis